MQHQQRLSGEMFHLYFCLTICEALMWLEYEVSLQARVLNAWPQLVVLFVRLWTSQGGGFTEEAGHLSGCFGRSLVFLGFRLVMR